MKTEASDLCTGILLTWYWILFLSCFLTYLPTWGTVTVFHPDMKTLASQVYCTDAKGQQAFVPCANRENLLL